MLVFFIHGVATRDAKYASKLQKRLKEKFLEQDQELPVFYSSFWGHALSDIPKIWNWISEDLRDLKKSLPLADTNNSFRYQKFREGFISEFAGDMFTYLNPQRGYEIRGIIAEQLRGFIQANPNEKDLHIISHSLGTVILWDALFSDRFSSDDPAFEIRELIKGRSANGSAQVNLISITTMGSPILFFNAMLGVSSEAIKSFVRQSAAHRLKWLNIIHASDLVAYPLRSSLGLEDASLDFQDLFISTDANFAETAARSVGQNEAAMALSASDAHNRYWDCEEILEAIADHLSKVSRKTLLKKAVALLKEIPGMTPDQLRLHLQDHPLTQIDFLDQSGYLKHVVNAAKIHHVYVFNSDNICQYSGYVGWLHTQGLVEALAYIQEQQLRWLDDEDSEG